MLLDDWMLAMDAMRGVACADCTTPLWNSMVPVPGRCF